MQRCAESLQFSDTFVAACQNLPTAIRKKLDRQLSMLQQNVSHPGLRVRKFNSRPGVWEARIDYCYRITFEWEGNTIRLRTVGKHDNIYDNP